jgi:hypothetical protein
MSMPAHRNMALLIRTRGLAVMAPDDMSAPPGAAEHDKTVRNCEKCRAAMKQLGELPALSVHAAIRVFRCYGRDHVVAEQA